MRRNWPHIALALVIIVLIVVFGACSLPGVGCRQYLSMSDEQQRDAALDWLVFTDIVDDRTSTTAETKVSAAQSFLTKQCTIQVKRNIPTKLNQFRP